MSNDDIFFGGGGDDRTVLRPTPGGRARPAAAPPPRQHSPQPPHAPPPMMPSGAPGAPGALGLSGALPSTDTSDLNRLAGAAAPLLALAARLGATVNHPDPNGLFRQVAQEVKNFEAAGRAAGLAPQAVLTARYALCTLLDEAVLNTPWGSQSVWSSQTLLNLFHNEGWGGEKFFQILDRLLQQPAANIDLLELMYLCMAMGLQGKYRISPAGRGQLDAIQANVLQVIRVHRGEVERELSPHWVGVQDARPKLARFMPLWVVGAIGAGAALLVYVGLLLALNAASDPVAAQVVALGRDVPQIVERAPQAPAQQVRLRDLLQAEVQQSLLEVRDQNGTETIVLREGLFPSGSGEVSSDKIALLESVAAALTALSGSIVIAGHTDDVPIATLRFPSNWALSERRAEAVREVLARQVAPERLTAEARADSEPLVPNSNAANRALNRRVEITLLPSPSRE